MEKQLAFLLVAFVSVAVPSHAAKHGKVPAHHSERKPFIGVWRVVSISDTRSDGTVVPDKYLGSRPAGFLIYDSSGYMCSGSMNPDRPKWVDPSKAAKEELATAAEGYDSYCGTFDVDEQHQKIIHHVRIGLVPNDVGLDLTRTYVFDGTRLKLSGTEGLKPGFTFWTFTLERAQPR